jgi:DNA-nicking Smr family endonuclease
MAAKDKLGHRPFERLKLDPLKTSAPRGQPKVSAARFPLPAAPARPKLPPPTPTASGEDDASLFAQAVRDVQRLADGPQRVLPSVAPRLPDPDAEDREVRAELDSLVSGELALDLSDTDEFVEGAVPDLDRRTRLRLRRGEFAVQAHLDLHGLTRDEAREALGAFFRQQRALGHRCVLVIHGRGLNSKDQVPVLKESMGRWLSRGSLGREVLGFCTARPCDGGAGALYVLLRR